ncbi:MAG: DUF1579 family protein [Planctomycetota bacterium]
MTTKTASYLSISFPLIAVVLGSAILLQDGKKKDAPPVDKHDPAAMGMPPMAKPGPEHEMLRKSIGVWDATMKMEGMPEGMPDGKGVETNTALGEFSIISDFRMPDFMGMPFHGHGVLGYSVSKKKYYISWTDSMSPEIMVSEGDYNKEKKTLSMTGEMDQGGTRVKSKLVTEMPNDDLRIFKMYNIDGGKEMLQFTIEYKRRK